MNIYETPKSDLTVEDNKPGSIVKAVVIGSVIEIAGTLITGLLIGFAYGFVLVSQNSSMEEIEAAMENLSPWSGYGLASLAAGLLVSVAAGYVCAKIANQASYKPAFILAFISFLLSVVLGVSSYPWWSLILFGAISACAVLIGARGYLRKLAPS